jgi:beta-lactam-binding protein with PASTA domain
VTATGAGGSVVADSAPGVAADACIVPKLVGKTLAAAQKKLEKANCALGKTKKKESDEKPGTVLSSSPAKGENLPAGTKVKLTVAN